jgi:hypothetical protein
MLALFSFMGVSTGFALAIHLGMHQRASECCHDSHHPEGTDHERQDEDADAGRHCDTCQQLGMFAKRFLVDSPKLLPEFAAVEPIPVHTANHYCYSHSLPPLQPRAPPACPIS